MGTPRIDLPPSEQFLASAVQFLVEGGDDEAAQLLLSCSLTVHLTGHTEFNFGKEYLEAEVELRGPRAVCDVMESRWENKNAEAIERALRAVLPNDLSVDSIVTKAALIGIDPGWREELLELARGKGVNNQAAEAGNAQIWQGLRFRSRSEIDIARALDKAGVLFLPNCRGRLGHLGQRVNREPDFLICHRGKWGILEVDGEPFHPPTRTVQDHERDRLFHHHGISLIQHYDATRCYNEPDVVVSEFLQLLAHS